MSKKYDICVFIGRMQPPTRAHIKAIEKALSIAERVIVILGSANQPRTIKNPFTLDERMDMLEDVFGATKPISYYAAQDFMYNDTQWVTLVQGVVDSAIDDWGFDKSKICILGHKKDESSFYLDMFPQWDFVEFDNVDSINATDLRDAYFSGQRYDHMTEYGSIGVKLNTFKDSDHYKRLVREYKHVKAYKKSWENAPYAPTFVTADAVVEQCGHILLVQRKAAPGEGLWALPGGFVNQNERIEDAAIRELREETRLKVPVPVLRGSIEKMEVFDHPQRSLRGRTITHAYLFRLSGNKLPPVRGGDDAKRAKWFSLLDVIKMENQMFEDHMSIIHKMLGV